MVVPVAERAQRIEDVDVELDVRVGHPGASGPGFGEEDEGVVGLAGALGEQPEAAGGDALSARVADLAGAGEGLPGGLGSGGRVAA